MVMTPLRSISLAVISGLGFINLSYSADEKFTLLKVQDLEIKQPTFDSLLEQPNSFTGPIMKMGLDSFYQQWPQTLEIFLSKDGFLMDLAFQYSGPFFTLFAQNRDLPQKLREISFLRSQGISFSTNDLSMITDKELIEAKNKVISSFFSQITDVQLQRFYGTIVTDAFVIEGLKFSDSKELFQSRINSLNKGEKTYKANIEKNRGHAFKLKDHLRHSINPMPLLTTPVGKYFVLETVTPFSTLRDVHKIKKVQLAPLAQVQKHRLAMKTKLIETLGASLYELNKSAFSKPITLSSNLPVVKGQIQIYNAVTELTSQYLKLGTKNLDVPTAQLIKEFIKHCNEQNYLLSPEEIKKDRDAVRLFTLVNIISYELLSPLCSHIERSKDYFNIERIRGLETLKEVQHPISMHLLLAQLYQETKNPKAAEEIQEYLKKNGLSHVSYLPLTQKLIEERSQKVQTVIENLKDISEEKTKELKEVLDKSKAEAIQKINS